MFQFWAEKLPGVSPVSVVLGAALRVASKSSSPADTVVLQSDAQRQSGAVDDHFPLRQVSVLAPTLFLDTPVPPKKSRGHFGTTNVCPPSWLKSASICFCIARMTVMTTMMENTPTSTPSNVSAGPQLVRGQCAHRHEETFLQFGDQNLADLTCVSFSILVPQGIHRVHPRGPPCRQKTRNHPGHQRHQNRQTHHRQRHARPA